MQRSKYTELLVELGKLAIGFLLALLIFLDILAFLRRLIFYECLIYGLTGAIALTLLILTHSIGYRLVCRGESS